MPTIKELKRVLAERRAEYEAAVTSENAAEEAFKAARDAKWKAHSALRSAEMAVKAAGPLSKRRMDILREACAADGAWFPHYGPRQRQNDADALFTMELAVWRPDGAGHRLFATDAGRKRLAEP